MLARKNRLNCVIAFGWTKNRLMKTGLKAISPTVWGWSPKAMIVAGWTKESITDTGWTKSDLKICGWSEIDLAYAGWTKRAKMLKK